MSNIEAKPYIETSVGLRPNITTESVDGVTIGRAVVPIRPFGGECFQGGFSRLAGILNKEFTDRDRGTLIHRLNNNNLEGGPLNLERPVSAYFTLDPNNRKIIIEWGKINLEDNLAKLHIYLNRMIDYSDRAKQGMKLSSGHIAKLQDMPGYVALLDNLPHYPQRINPATPMGKMINTLHVAGFLPITPAGFAQPRATI